MVLDIFSIGDSAFLAAILNAVAMIAGTGDYAMAAGIGGLLGVILMMLRGLLQWDGRGLRYQEMITAMLVYLTLFAPGVKVAIEDAYTGQVRVVDNVPLGPAAAGSIISNLGYRLTRLFEQVFSTPGMTQYGFADSLQVITAVRKNLLSRMALGKANAPVGGSDLEASVVNYVKECTLTGVDLNLTSLDSIFRTPDVMGVLRFDSEIYTTEIYPGGVPRILTCTEAWTVLDDLVRAQGVAGLEARLKDILQVPTAGDVQPRIQAALDALTTGSVNAQDYLLAATLLPMFEKGIVGRHEDSLHWNRAAMVEQAIQQRNAQWAAEQTLFTRIVRPMLTWIEGFSFAVTPLMAFAVMLGARGIQISGQYLLMLLWIQLWMPILAVVNLYITLSAGGALAALNAAQFNLPSLAGLYRMDMELQNWLAVGGMLASYTPAIALMLVYGGSITATHFLGRMQGGDFVDEKIVSPPVVSPAPFLNLQATHQHAPLMGTALSGAERVLPTFQAGQELSASVSSAQTALQQASRGFMETLSNKASHSVGLSQEGFDSHSLGQRISSSQRETDRFLKSTGEDFSQRYRDSGVSSDDFAALVGGAASGMFQRGPGSRKDRDRTEGAPAADGDWETTGRLQAGLSGQLQNRFHVERSRADEIATDITQRVTTDQGWQTDLARSIATDVQSCTREVASLGLQRQDLSSLQKTAQDTVSASETYQETASAQRRFGTSASFGALETGHRIAGTPANLALLESTLDRFGLRGDAQRLGAEWRAIGLINDQDQAYAAAGMALLTGHASPVLRPLDAQEAWQAEVAGYGLLGEVFQARRPDGALQPDRNAGVRAEAPAPGAVRSKVEAEPWHDPRGETQNLEGQARNQIRQVSGRIDQGESKVTAAHGASRTGVAAQSDAGVQAMHADKAAYFREEIRKAANSDSSPAELEYDVLGGGIYDVAQKVSSIGNSAVQGFLVAFDRARERGLGLGDSLIKAVRDTPTEASNALNAWTETRVAETGDRLTAPQQAYYRAALLESLAGLPLSGDYNPTLGNQSAARERLQSHEGEMAADIANLLRRAAGQNRPDLLDLLANFNRARSLDLPK